jgi:phage gpG-like protein
VTTGARVEVVGADTLAAGLRRVAAGLDHLEVAGARTGQAIRTRASSRAPKLSGRLAQSIRANAAGDTVSVGSDLVYAPVQEFGWAGHGIAAQPYLMPAANEVGAWLPFYEDEVQGLLNNVRGA